MKALRFENGLTEKPDEGDRNTQNVSKVSWSAHKEFSNGDCPMTSSTLDGSTISVRGRHDNFTYQASYLCKNPRRGDIMNYNKETSKARNQRKIVQSTDMFIEPFCIASKRKCQGK